MTKKIELGAENLISAKKSFDETKQKRQTLEKSLLENEKYKKLLEGEKILEEQYNNSRTEFILELKENNQEENVRVDSGLIIVKKSLKPKITDEQQFIEFIKEDGKFEELTKTSIKVREADKYILDKVSDGAKIDGVNVSEEISISIKTN